MVSSEAFFLFDVEVDAIFSATAMPSVRGFDFLG
jgi:hypothetical protein